MKCKTKNCCRNLGPGNLSGYCYCCYMKVKSAKYRKKRKKEKVCFDCGKKVNEKIIYPNGLDGIKIVEFPIRCYSCTERIKKKFLK